MRPLTKNATNGTYAKYYPSVAFHVKATSATLLTRNFISLIEAGKGNIGKIRRIGKMGRIGKIRKIRKIRKIGL